MENIAQHKFCRKEDFRKTEKWDVDKAEGPCTKKKCKLKRNNANPGHMQGLL